MDGESMFAHQVTPSEGVVVEGAYARANGASAKAGAAFMVIKNYNAQDDRLIAASTDVANMVELHTHIEGENGIMMMRPDEDGFDLPANGEAHLKRGGDHVMMMGLKHALNHGDTVEITLVFEKAGEITIQIPVDLERKPASGEAHH
ncbi:copper chaperone PCu(A)C [Amylibacter sp. SFDW26]|nr:copper chaperone PCu(A)C [Amylibacter sp. SFDW26]